MMRYRLYFTLISTDNEDPFNPQPPVTVELVFLCCNPFEVLKSS